MALRTHPPEVPNPGHISDYDKLPRFWSDRERKFQARDTVAEGLAGKETWDMYHKKLPLGHVPLAQPLADKLTKKEDS